MKPILFTRKNLAISLLGLTSGVPLGIVITLIQTWLTEAGINLKTVGLISLVQLPYTLKFLWSPIMDRFHLPFLGRRHGWMLVCQLGLIASTAALGFFDPAKDTWLIALLAMLISFLGASHDIVIDAYRRDVLDDAELGMGSAVASNSYLIGFRFLAVVMGLTLADTLSWSRVYLILSLLPLLGVLGTLLAPKPRGLPSAPKNIRDAVVQPFLNFLMRPGAYEILIFILLYKIGDNLAANLLTPFYLKMGYSKTEIAWVGKMVGFWATFIGGFIAGAVLARVPIGKCLLWFGFLQAASTLCFMALTGVSPNLYYLCTVVGFENLTAGMGSAVFATFMLRLCDKRFSATQYALLTSFMGVPRTIIPSVAGFIAEPLGWNAFFVICTVAAIPGLMMVYFRSHKWDQ